MLKAWEEHSTKKESRAKTVDCYYAWSLVTRVDELTMFSRTSWKAVVFVFLCCLVWLKLFDIVSYRITRKWEVFFHYYDGYRLPASISAFVPFVLETLKADTSDYKIIFTGDSTSGGLLYHHSQAIPAYLNGILGKSGWDVHTYNLGLSGAHLSEQYLLMKETLPYADVIVFPIHYSFFAGRGPNKAFIFHPELIDVLNTPNGEDLSPLGLHSVSTFERRITAFLNNQWYTYKVHKILPFITLGEPARLWIRGVIDLTLNRITNHIKKPQFHIDPTLPFLSQNSMVQQEIIDQNRQLWQEIDFVTSDNTNLTYLNRICILKKTSRKNFMAYIVPLDMNVLEKEHIINSDKYEQIIEMTKRVLDECSISHIDFNKANPANLTPADYYNPDHLLPVGNEKVAEVLARKIRHDFQ